MSTRMIVLYAFLVVIVLCGCSDDGLSPRGSIGRADEPSDASTVYVSLAEGNYWQYAGEKGGGRWEMRVSDHVVVDGTTYAVVELDRGRDFSMAYWRVDERGRIFISDANSKRPRVEWLYLDPTLAVGESYDNGSLDLQTITSKDAVEIVPAGFFERCLTLSQYSFHHAGETFAPGIGVIRHWSMNGDYVLVEARIDGVRYPR